MQFWYMSTYLLSACSFSNTENSTGYFIFYYFIYKLYLYYYCELRSTIRQLAINFKFSYI